MRRLQPNLFYSKVDPYLEKTLTDSFEVAFVDKITDRVEVRTEIVLSSKFDLNNISIVENPRKELFMRYWREETSFLTYIF